MKIKNKIKLLFLLCLTISFLSSTFGFETLGNKTISAWLPYWNVKNSADNFEDNFSEIIQEINPFVYVFDENANIINACKDQKEYKRIINLLHSTNVKILPTITNDVFYSKSKNRLKDPFLTSQILQNENLRKKHIQQIMNIIKETGAQGVDIDYESININDRDAFSEFIKELAIAVHSENKTLTVTVQQKTQDHRRSGPGAIDWKEISKYADKITIMCYNYSSKLTKPGPVCPYFWLKKIIRFARIQIPTRKICIALALHGYDWSKNETKSLSFDTAKSLLERYSAKLRWDKKSLTPYFFYYKNGVKHQVWFENKKSIAEKIKIIKRYKIPHISFWHLGILDPSLSKELELFLS